MAVQDVRRLLEKLNDTCTKSLELSIGMCVSRGQYEVRWEHFFSAFLDSNEGDIPVILRHFGVDASALRKGVNTELESLRSGNTGKPAFSPPFLDVLEQAWSFSSLTLGLPSISSGVMLIAAMERGLHAMASYATVLKPVNVDVLKSKFFEILASSSEQAKSSAPGPQAAAVGQDVLTQFCTNFTQLARDGKIDPILGRDDEIRKSLDILNRRRKNNPILVGEAGVGKTAIVEGLALRIANGDVPDHLKQVDLWGLDLGLLQAGASVKGEFEKRLKNVIDAIKASPKPTILFIDEAHTLIGAGGSAGQNDAANLLKPALARGELRTMAATTWSEYRKYFEKDPALARRFQLVAIEEPSEEQCCIMLRGIGASYEKHHGVRITYEGIKSAVALSHRYISGRQLPDKAVDVLDTAGARVKMSQSTKPSALDSTERSLLNAKLELKTLAKDQDAGIPELEEQIEACNLTIKEKEEEVKLLTQQWEKEKQLVTQIISVQNEMVESKLKNKKADVNLQKKLDGLTAELETIQGENPMVFPHVSAGVCAQVVADWTGIPVGSMVKDEAQTLLELDKRLAERVLGQDDALAELANSIRAAKTGMGNPDAPIGVFLFTGPSGVGKTECALALASELFGGEKFLTTINMSEYQESHTVSQLKGSPPGYVGYGEGGILTEAVRQKPYSLVLLDEVEKAHLEVMNLFYQVFDKGFMRDGEGREINFRNTLIIMTSNLGSEEIIDLCSKKEGESPSFKQIVDTIRPSLSAHFQPALLGRCKIIPFRPLDKDIMRGVVALKLDKLAQRIEKAHGLQFSCSADLVDQLAQGCTAIESGARNADLVIDQNLLPAISRQLLQHLGEEDKEYTRLHIQSTPEGDFEIIFSEAEDGDVAVNAEPSFDKAKAEAAAPAEKSA